MRHLASVAAEWLRPLALLIGLADHAAAGPPFPLDDVEKMLPRAFRQAGDAAATIEGTPAGFRLRQVATQMRAIEATLAAEDLSGRASATQTEVLADLDAMLTRLQKQCDQCSGGAKPPSAAQRRVASRGNKPGAAPGEAVATTPQGAAAAAINRQAIGQLVRDVWGELPQRQRDELLQPLADEFLPQYAAEIEAYFRALAEGERAAATEEELR